MKSDLFPYKDPSHVNPNQSQTILRTKSDRQPNRAVGVGRRSVLRLRICSKTVVLNATERPFCLESLLISLCRCFSLHEAPPRIRTVFCPSRKNGYGQNKLLTYARQRLVRDTRDSRIKTIFSVLPGIRVHLGVLWESSQPCEKPNSSNHEGKDVVQGSVTGVRTNRESVYLLLVF